MGEIDDWRERHARNCSGETRRTKARTTRGLEERRRKEKEKREKEKSENKKNWRIGSQKKDSRLARHVMSWEAH
jgi:hypothetical protein